MVAKALGKRMRSIAVLDREDCKAEWEQQFGSAPDRYLSTQLMRRALLHEAQISVFGGLSARDRRALGLRRSIQNKVAPQPSTSIISGTRLVREWNGRSYSVAVIDAGFELDGRRYRSLTAVAKHITGAHWSGPRFFGIS